MSSRSSIPPTTLRVGIVSTFPPRMCGLATFAADASAALRTAGAHTIVAALVDPDESVGPDVDHRLVRTNAAASAVLAHALSGETDVVLIQHEFGIFGGADGALLSELTSHLTVPYVLTLHTVLEQFTAGQLAAISEPLDGAAMVLVFSLQAADLLAAQFPQLRSRCRVVPHGAPPELLASGDDRIGLRGHLGVSPHTKVVSTFGLLSPGKGVEHAMSAIAALAPLPGELVYVVAGRTHPGVLRRSGEAYRTGLIELAAELGIEHAVVFEDWFHDIGELARLLRGTDVFVTPYENPDQIVSGALSFAIAAGVPFVSTAYRYAVEMAAAGCGVTVPVGDPSGLATALRDLLADDQHRRRLAANARRIGRSLGWPSIGERLLDVLLETIELAEVRSSPAVDRSPAA